MADLETSLRLLILNVDLPFFPGRIGCEYLHTTYLAKLGNHVGLASLVHTQEQREKKHSLMDAGVELYVWENPYLDRPAAPATPQRRFRLRRLARIVYDTLRTLSGRPADTFIQDLQFRNIAPYVIQALSARDWDALIVVQSQCAHWIDSMPGDLPSVLVLHDVRALMYERQAAVAASLPERITALLEAWRYRRWEGKYCRRYDLVVTVSEADEAWVRAHYQPKHLVTIPLPVDPEYFAPDVTVSEQSHRIMFTGMMRHPPNVEAVCFFAHDVFPQIRTAVPDAEFWIVGREPAPEVDALAQLPGVVVTGYVADIRPYIASANVIVVPLRFGSGMRNKILEAWSMQKCVVSTTIGAEGLLYREGDNILIADDAPTLASKIIRVLHDPALRERLKQSERELVVTHHHPEQLARRYSQAIAGAVRCKHKAADALRSVIDLRWMRPGVAGGIENLSRSFLDTLVGLDQHNQYTVLVPPEVVYDFDLRYQDNFCFVTNEHPTRDLRKAAWRASRFVHNRLRVDYWRSPQVEALRAARDVSAEVALSLSGYIMPDLNLFRNVLVFADLQHEYFPEFFSSEVLEERKRIFSTSIYQADYLIAISEFTRQTVLERFSIAPDKITTGHLAADPRFHPENWRPSELDRVLEKYHLPRGEYLFFPANTWAHKNHRTALEALAIVRDRFGLAPLLVLSGAVREGHPALIEQMQRLKLTNQVRFLGYCPADDIPALYRGAAALVYPSLFEGFGIPLVEAMWCHCPIVCSNTTSLPEIAGDAALMVDPRSAEALAEAIGQVLTNTDLRTTLIEHGCQQAQRFSWMNFTLQTVRTLHRVCKIS